MGAAICFLVVVACGLSVVVVDFAFGCLIVVVLLCVLWFDGVLWWCFGVCCRWRVLYGWFGCGICCLVCCGGFGYGLRLNFLCVSLGDCGNSGLGLVLVFGFLCPHMVGWGLFTCGCFAGWCVGGGLVMLLVLWFRFFLGDLFL